jgi:hypothetical protein
MKDTIGCAFIHLNAENLGRISEYKQLLEKELVQGRQCLVIWEVKSIKEKHIPFEANVLENFLNSPSSRSREDSWAFFGNGAIRCYGKSNTLRKTYFWILLLKNGPKAYTRVKSVSKQTLEESRIPVDDYAFTRDVANNVWHLRYEDHWKSILYRFKNLTSWADEKILVILPGGITRRHIGKLYLGKDDIPKVEKVSVSHRLNNLVTKKR